MSDDNEKPIEPVTPKKPIKSSSDLVSNEAERDKAIDEIRKEQKALLTRIDLLFNKDTKAPVNTNKIPAEKTLVQHLQDWGILVSKNS